jgi:hypothetical protein
MPPSGQLPTVTATLTVTVPAGALGDVPRTLEIGSVTVADIQSGAVINPAVTAPPGTLSLGDSFTIRVVGYNSFALQHPVPLTPNRMRRWSCPF